MEDQDEAKAILEDWAGIPMIDIDSTLTTRSVAPQSAQRGKLTTDEREALIERFMFRHLWR